MAIQERAAQGEVGVQQSLDSIQHNLAQGGVKVASIPLGGTIAMVLNPNTGNLESVAEGAFTSAQIQAFNNRRLLYVGGSLVEPSSQRSRKFKKLPIRRELFFGSLRDTDSAGRSIRGEQILNNGVWELPKVEHAVQPGMHTAAALPSKYDIPATAYYASRLSREITSGKYPNGVRLDSNDIWSRGEFPAVVCSYLIPTIDKKVQELAELHNIPYKEAMKRAIFIVPIGTDTEVEVNSFLDLLGFFTGMTFITVGANSSFGTPKGDAEANLKGTELVAQAIHKGKLTRGKAYAVADEVVMWNLIKKMHPDETGLRKGVKAPDGYYYGSTFQAYHALPLSRLESPRLQAYYAPQYNPSLYYRLRPISYHFSNSSMNRKLWRKNAAEKSLDLAYAQGSIYRCNVRDIPKTLPYGTRVLIVEGTGEANGPDYAIQQIKRACDQLSKRTMGLIRPTIIITSSAGFAYVGDKYSAGLYKGLSEIGEKVVSGRTITPETLESMATLLLNYKMSRSVRLHEKAQSEYRLEPWELEKVINEYGINRQLPHFND